MLCQDERISKVKGSSCPANARLAWYSAGKGKVTGLHFSWSPRGVEDRTWVLKSDRLG